MNEKVVANIPWSNIMRLIAKLVRYGKGGITKEEARDLGEELLLLAAELLEKH
jgi:hypothetical protein